MNCPKCKTDCGYSLISGIYNCRKCGWKSRTTKKRREEGNKLLREINGMVGD